MAVYINIPRNRKPPTMHPGCTDPLLSAIFAECVNTKFSMFECTVYLRRRKLPHSTRAVHIHARDFVNFRNKVHASRAR